MRLVKGSLVPTTRPSRPTLTAADRVLLRPCDRGFNQTVRADGGRGGWERSGWGGRGGGDRGRRGREGGGWERSE